MSAIREYHSRPEWSPTKLKAALSGSMRKWYHKYGSNAKPFEPSIDMIKGSVVDALLTPPFRIPMDEYLIVDSTDRRTKAGKAACEAAEAQGLKPLTEAFILRAQSIADALREDPDVAPILEALIPESSQQPHYWSDEAGRPCRCLPDVVTKHGVYDLKKTRSANPRKLYWQSMDLAYDLQMAHLALGFEDQTGRQPTEAGIIGYEWPDDPDDPIETCVLMFSEHDLEAGRARREEAFARIAECQRSGIWPSYGIQPFSQTPVKYDDI